MDNIHIRCTYTNDYHLLRVVFFSICSTYDSYTCRSCRLEVTIIRLYCPIIVQVLVKFLYPCFLLSPDHSFPRYADTYVLCVGVKYYNAASLLRVYNCVHARNNLIFSRRVHSVYKY